MNSRFLVSGNTQGKSARLRRLCPARCCASQLGLLEFVQRAAIEHDLTYVPGFGALLDLVVRDDPTHVDQSLFLFDLFPAQRRNLAGAHAGVEGELEVGRVDPHRVGQRLI